jgi:peptide/nickel transport system permease protein
MIETLRLQYVTTARAKGLSENRVIYKHALRNAINPLITLLGLEFAALFTGAAILENVINFPGMGQLILEALRAKDQALVMASFLIGSVMLVIGNLLADILLAVADPRVTYA